MSVNEYQRVCFALSAISIPDAVAGFGSTVCKLQSRFTNMHKNRVRIRSAAFDHNILIKYLSMWYGISGTALSWFSSYLTDRY